MPENQLVRWLVASVLRGIDTVAKRASSIPPAMDRVRTAARDALGHPWFSEVPPPTDLEPHMMACAERQRLPGYHDAARLADRRARLEDRHPAAYWRAVLELLRSDWLEPLDPDDLFELYALVLVLDVLEHDLGLGPPSEFGLIAGDRPHVAAFDAGVRVRVLFDQSPANALKFSSRFDAVDAEHEGLSSRPRRPDIVVAADGDQPRAVLVEVKRTASERYKSDSVYKSFAYLHDLAAMWDARPTVPKLILLLPEGVRPRAGADLSKMDLVVAAATDRTWIRNALSQGLGLGKFC